MPQAPTFTHTLMTHTTVVEGPLGHAPEIDGRAPTSMTVTVVRHIGLNVTTRVLLWFPDGVDLVYSDDETLPRDRTLSELPFTYWAVVEAWVRRTECD